MKHSSARLIAKTMPVDEEFGRNLSEFIAYVARVSNPANQWNHDTARKLLGYLERENHWSPFEMANLVIEVKTQRDIGRQILRHRSGAFQEFSQRYAEANMFCEPKEARLQDHKNRQNSVAIDDFELQNEWSKLQQRVIELTNQSYEWAIKNGIAKECARVILPEGLTNSTLYINMNIRSWIHYIAIRADNATQKEHREVAQLINPIVTEALYGKEILND